MSSAFTRRTAFTSSVPILAAVLLGTRKAEPQGDYTLSWEEFAWKRDIRSERTTPKVLARMRRLGAAVRVRPSPETDFAEHVVATRSNLGFLEAEAIKRQVFASPSCAVIRTKIERTAEPTVLRHHALVRWKREGVPAPEGNETRFRNFDELAAWAFNEGLQVVSVVEEANAFTIWTVERSFNELASAQAFAAQIERGEIQHSIPASVEVLER